MIEKIGTKTVSSGFLEYTNYTQNRNHLLKKAAQKIAFELQGDFLLVTKLISTSLSRVSTQYDLSELEDDQISIVIEATIRKVMQQPTNTANDYIKYLPRNSPIMALHDVLLKDLITAYSDTNENSLQKLSIKKSFSDYFKTYSSSLENLFSLSGCGWKAMLPIANESMAAFIKNNVHYKDIENTVIFLLQNEINTTNLAFMQKVINKVSNCHDNLMDGKIYCSDYFNFEKEAIRIIGHTTYKESDNFLNLLFKYRAFVQVPEHISTLNSGKLIIEFAERQLEKDIKRLQDVCFVINGAPENIINIGSLFFEEEVQNFSALKNRLIALKFDILLNIDIEVLALALSFAAAQSVQAQVMKMLGLITDSIEGQSNSTGEANRRKRLLTAAVVLWRDKFKLEEKGPDSPYQAKIEILGDTISVSICDLTWGFPYYSSANFKHSQTKFTETALEIAINPKDIKIKNSLMLPRFISCTYDTVIKKSIGDKQLNIWTSFLGEDFEDIANQSKISSNQDKNFPELTKSKKIIW